MFGQENLVRRIEIAVVDPTLLDLHYAVHTRNHHDEHRTGDGLDYDWAAPAFHPIQAHDHQLPQRGLEHEDHDQSHFGEYQREEDFNHVDQIRVRWGNKRL